MIFKQTLILLLAVAFQQFANGVPLDNPGKQLERNDMQQQRPAEQCGNPNLRCRDFGEPPKCVGACVGRQPPAGVQCAGPTLACWSDLGQRAVGSCVLCGETYVPDRMDGMWRFP